MGMGLLNRLTGDPRSPNSPRISRGGARVAGVRITPDTALQISAVWACISFLATTVAKLPWHVFEPLPSKTDSKGVRTGGGAQVAETHPTDWVIYKRPNPEWSSFQLRETLLHWALRYGNGYAEIVRDQSNRVTQLWPIHPDRVEVKRRDGVLYYEVRNDDAGRDKIELSMMEMFHIRGFGDGVVGVNVIDYAATTLGWARAAQLYSAAFFGNGATPNIVVKNKKKMTPEGLDRQKEEFRDLFGGPTKAGKTAHLDMDSEIEVISLNPTEMQLLSTHQHLVEEVCRWFGVPPHKIMHLMRSTFSNIEHQAIEVVVDSVSPWTQRFQDEADYKFFGANRRGWYTKINMNALLRGDMKARGEWYRNMQNLGAYSPNKILELEDENGIGPDGDIHVMQGAMATLDRIANPPEPKPMQLPAPAKSEDDDDEPPPAGDNGGPPLDDEETAEARAMIEALYGMYGTWLGEPVNG